MVQSISYVDHLNLHSTLQTCLPLKYMYSQTLLLRTWDQKKCPYYSVLIKRVNFKENVWRRGTKKTVCNNKCPY